MIVDRVYAYLNGEKAPIEDEALALAGTLIQNSMHRNFGKQRGKSVRLPSPSSKWACHRRIFWDADATLEREPVTARSLITFNLGDMVEQMGIVLARQALGDQIITPHKETGEQLEVTKEIGGFEYAGHVDMTVLDEVHGEVPVDWKSMAEISFGMFKAAATDPAHKWWRENADGYIAQVRFYMMAMAAKRGYLVAVCKNTGHLAEVEIRDDPEENERLARKFIEINQSIRANALPERPEIAAQIVERRGVELPGGGRGKCQELNMQATKGFSWMCGYCPYTLTCFPGFSVVPLGKPMYRKRLDS